jgi:hypothetical protein
MDSPDLYVKPARYRIARLPGKQGATLTLADVSAAWSPCPALLLPAKSAVAVANRKAPCREIATSDNWSYHEWRFYLADFSCSAILRWKARPARLCRNQFFSG